MIYGEVRMKKIILLIMVLAIGISVNVVYGASATLTFTELTGVTGGSPAATAVFRADLSGLGLATIESLTIRDSNSKIGGASGQFSGFDLDAVKLSTTSVPDASGAAALAGLAVFDFSSAGTLFFPGTQRPPIDPALFGTLGGQVDNSVATLGAFDGNSTTVVPGADGFVSLGDGGRVIFNLTSAVPTTGLFLYIGEVGNNGEVAAGTIFASDTPTVPVPGTLYLLGSGLLGLVGFRKKFLA
jgi:hypothetical protein